MVGSWIFLNEFSIIKLIFVYKSLFLISDCAAQGKF